VRSTPPPAIVRLFASAKSNSLVSNTGARAQESSSSGDGPWVARANTTPPRGRRRRRRGQIFEMNAAVSRHPAHGPAKPSNTEVTGQSAAGIGITVGVIEGEQAVITAANTHEQHANRQSNFGPTCRLVPSPEAGPGATIGTLDQGYPLLRYEDVMPVRLSLAAWRTAPRTSRGQKRWYTLRQRHRLRTSSRRRRTAVRTARTPEYGPGPPE
jgi:hypothetical protein